MRSLARSVAVAAAVAGIAATAGAAPAAASTGQITSSDVWAAPAGAGAKLNGADF